MMIKKTVAVLFGGQSAEHDISIISASNIINNIPLDKYKVLPIAIDRSGTWWFSSNYNSLVNSENKIPKLSLKNATRLNIKPGHAHPVFKEDNNEILKIDVIFSILHGPPGEDGSMQGLFRILGLPFVGPDLLGSAVAMDKDIMKRLFIQANIPTSQYQMFRSYDKQNIDPENIIKSLGLPLYVKPANMGSSIGISRVEKKDQLESAIREAFLYDQKIIIEKSITGKELEVAILQNNDLFASCIGEIIPRHNWYSYESKYIDADGAKLVIPAEISQNIEKKIQDLAIRAFQALDLEGMSRVDLFLTEENELYLNEINTLPGFTSISMYPKLLEKSGISQNELMDQLIQSALQRFEKNTKLKTKADPNSG